VHDHHEHVCQDKPVAVPLQAATATPKYAITNTRRPDKTTRHSTGLSKDDSPVAGYSCVMPLRLGRMAAALAGLSGSGSRLLDVRNLGAFDADAYHQSLLVKNEGVSIILQRCR